MIRDEGIDRAEAARRFWGGGYDPGSDEFTDGPFRIHFATALEAVWALCEAVQAAGWTVDGGRNPHCIHVHAPLSGIRPQETDRWVLSR